MELFERKGNYTFGKSPKDKRKEAVMKKTLTVVFVVVLSLLLVLPAFGQETTKGITAKGIKAGLNMAKETGSDASGAKMLLGFAGGAFLEYSFTPMFAVQPEVLFSMEGSKFNDETIEGVTVSPKLTLDYINIPVFFKVKPEVKGNFKPNIFAGPFLGILMSAKAKGEVSGGGTAVSGSVDVKDQFKSTNFGIAFGVGAAQHMEKGMITLDVRYALGLSKIAKSETVGGVSVTPNVKTSCFSILIGYGFK
jgi:hypothetical protein